jgi:hypothetical protein
MFYAAFFVVSSVFWFMLFAKLVARIERENQRALSPLKELVQTLK